MKQGNHKFEVDAYVDASFFGPTIIVEARK